MSYIEMGRWINVNAYKDNADMDTVIRYCCCIAVMLARNSNYFRYTELYDDFGVFVATRVYQRIVNKKQYEIDPKTGQPRMRKIENFLAYIQSIVYPCKVDFQNSVFYKGYISECDIETFGNKEEGSYKVDKDPVVSFVENQMGSITRIENELTLSNIASVIKKFFSRTPYSKNLLLYNSCLFTLHKYFQTLSDNQDQYYSVLNRNIEPSYQEPLDMKDCVVLYHLEKPYESLVIVLCRRIYRYMMKELVFTLNRPITSNQLLSSVLYSGLEHCNMPPEEFK